MAKIQSTLLNMFLSLTTICLVSGAILAFVNDFTKGTIATMQKEKLENSIREVTPEFDNSPLDESYTLYISNNDSAIVYPARKNGELVGVAVETITMNGFSGLIRILTGLKANGEIINYSVLTHAETPGLGDKMASWFREEKGNQSILGRDLSQSTLKLSKDGGDIDAITASTITSRAFLEAVNKAYAAYAGNTKDADSGATDASSGATQDANSGATSK